MCRCSVALAPSDGPFNETGEAMISNPDRKAVRSRTGPEDEIFASEIWSEDSPEERMYGGVEKKLYPIGYHRVHGLWMNGCRVCPFPYMQDLVMWRFKQVKDKEGEGGKGKRGRGHCW
jgi:formamidase